MFSHASEELIWHFAGYLHLAEALSKTPTTFNSYYSNSEAEEIFVAGSDTGPEAKFNTGGLKNMPAPTVVEFDESTDIPFGFSGSTGTFGTQAASPGIATVPQNFPVLDRSVTPSQSDASPVAPRLEGPTFQIKATYTEYSELSEYIELVQMNLLSDSDRLLAGEVEGVPSEEEILELLDELVEKAEQAGPKVQIELGATSEPGVTGFRVVNGELQPVTAGDDEDEGDEAASDGEADTGGGVKMGTQEIETGGNQQGNFAEVVTDPGSGPLGDIEVDQSNELDDDDTITDAVVQNLGTLEQNVGEPTDGSTEGDGATSDAEVGAELLTQEIDTGSNGQVNIVDIDVDQDGGPVYVDAEIDQSNELSDEDTLDNPEVINEGTAKQNVDATGGSASAGDSTEGPEEAEQGTGEAQDTQTGPYQTASLGGNEVSNIASIVDLGESKGSLIVEGDYHLKTMIHQSIVVVDDDQVETNGPDGTKTKIDSGQNTAVNDAEWINEAGAVFGNASLGAMLPGMFWQIDYVKDDFYDVTEIYQETTIYDNDVNVQSQINSYSNVDLGGNSVFNEAHAFENWKDYDLIIVNGDYHQEISIFQTSVLLDNDIVSLTGGHGADDDSDGPAQPGQQIGETSGNELFNEASITTVGSEDRFKDLDDNQNVGDLFDQIERQETEFDVDPELALDLPGNGSNVFKVLFIDGDYYDIKSIYQKTILADADFSLQDMDASYEDEDDDDEQGLGLDGDALDDLDEDDIDSFLQQVESGGNSQLNSASIVDVASTSDFQYIGGEYYRSDFLYQAELVTNDVDEIYEKDSPEEALAALSNQSGPEAVEAKELLLTSTASSTDDDMVGSVLG